MIVALAAAIALIEIATMIIPSRTYAIARQPVERVTIAKLVHIEHRALVKPTPRPTARPTLKPVVHVKTIAPTHVQPHIINPGRPSEHQRVHRVASARPRVRTRYHSKPAATHVVMGGQGTGTSTTAKPLTGSVGTGGQGAGESGAGQGTGGAPAAQEPCGAVYFSPTGKPRIDPATGRVWEYVAVMVNFPDGSQQSVDLDYPFYYPSEAQDPFIHENLDATFQFPPASEAASEPPLIQYVMKHTTAEGYTLLRDCPK